MAARPIDRNGLGLSIEAAQAELARLEAFFPLRPDSPAVYPEWRRLVATHPITGLRVYDARLVAVMLVHGIDHVLTFNVDDFRRYPGISVVHPRDVQPGA